MERLVGIRNFFCLLRARHTLNINKRQVLFIFSVLFTEIGCNYCMDIPGSLEVNMNKYYGLTSTQFSLLYSLYSLPTIFTNIIGGIIIDRWLGIKWTSVLFSVVTVFGLGIFAAGGLINLYWMMLLGRLFFGLGNEISTGVCVSYCMFAFYNKIVNFINIVNACFSYLGTMAIFQSAPRLFDWLSAGTSLSNPENLGLVILITSSVILPTVVFAFWMTTLGPERTNEEINIERERKLSNAENDFKLLGLFKFPALFWVLCLFSVVRAATTTFTQFTQGMFTEEMKMTVYEASNAVTISNVTSIVLSIPVSILVDKFGRNMFVVILSVVLTLVPHILLHFDLTPYFSMLLIGVSNGLYGSASLPMFGYAVNDPKLIGSCYGIQSSMNGLAMTLTPLIIGLVIDKYGFRTGQLYYVVIAAVSICCSILVWILDKNNTGILAMSARNRDNFMRNRIDTTQDCDDQPESFASTSMAASIATNYESYSSFEATPYHK